MSLRKDVERVWASFVQFQVNADQRLGNLEKTISETDSKVAKLTHRVEVTMLEIENTEASLGREKADRYALRELDQKVDQLEALLEILVAKHHRTMDAVKIVLRQHQYTEDEIALITETDLSI